jgi:hypothetical protein
MNKSLRKTITGLVILSLILFSAGFIIFKAFLPEKYYGFFPVVIVFFFLVNAAFFVFFHRSLNKSPNQFIRNFMASTGIKLVIYFLLIISYMLASPKTALTFGITVSVAYITYTAYDLIVMLSLVKRNKEISEFPDHLSN